MSTSFVDAKEPSKKDKEETSSVKYKLRISLIFRTISSSQKEKAKAFRSHDNTPICTSNDLAQELSGSQISYNDQDEQSGEYIIDDVCFAINEDSVEALKVASKAIDNYLMRFCLQDNIEKVVPCLFVPSFCDVSVVPSLFFQDYTPRCISEEGQKGIFEKIDNQKGYVYSFEFDKIESITPTRCSSGSGGCSTLTQTFVQLAALVSYYVYYYIDTCEQTNRTKKKENLADPRNISSYIEKEHPEKSNMEKGNPEKSNLLGKTASIVKDTVLFPINATKSLWNYLFDYDGHMKNRLYNRIWGVIAITKPEESQESAFKEAISNLIMISHKGEPADIHSFFAACDYWTYLKNGNPEEKCELEEICKQWKVKEPLEDFDSGYGAVLLSNGEDNIVGFKGTDMDSYWKDWARTNILQGLTGSAKQYKNAIADGKKIDEEVGNAGSLWFVGHSLGGGLASAATIATERREGITFNAAGLNIRGSIYKKLKPLEGKKRVHPYRIKGEMLDGLQSFLEKIPKILKIKAYGEKSVEYDVSSKIESGFLGVNLHGINNFLYKEVMEQLKPFDQIIETTKSSEVNKIKKIIFEGKETSSNKEP